MDWLEWFTPFWVDWLLDLSFDQLADWADDLMVTLMCWLQMGWCWLYTTALDLFTKVLEAALPVLPDIVLDFALVLNYYDVVDAWLPVTESLVLLGIYFPFYARVRLVYLIQPWVG